MLNRPLLTAVAKSRMANTGLKIYFYTLFVMVISAIPDVIIQLNMPALPINYAGGFEEMMEYFEQASQDMSVPLIAGVVLMVYNIFVSIINIGYSRVCLMTAREEQIAFRDIFEAFGFWVKAVLLMLVQGIIILLGTLCFIVPGIILSFSYSQTTFVLIDNPDAGIFEILRTSREMMDGHKIEFFVFELSYILWNMLTAVIGVASVFVLPYMHVGRALYYEHLCGYQRFGFRQQSAPPTDSDTDE
ncbi:MAG: DUF975 family protein [Clostridia bacterium]|nr:DUF975 family protein [Clostridia bacterium]